MARIYSITNQKGGVGKTTTSINLGAALANLGKKILIVDFDPQANATQGIGVEITDNDKTIIDVLNEKEKTYDYIIKNVKPNIDVIAGDVMLSSMEATLTDVADKDKELKKALDTVRDKYDYIIIDCPPAVGIITVNALVASDACIIPLQCEYFALEGLNQVMQVIDQVKSRMNPNLEIAGVLFTMFDSRTALAKDVVNGVKSSVSVPTFETIVPRNVRLAEAPSNGMSIFEFDMKSVGASRYQKLAKEILEKDGLLEKEGE